MFINIQRYASLAGLLVTLRHLYTSTDSIYKCHIDCILCTRHRQLDISRIALLFVLGVYLIATCFFFSHKECIHGFMLLVKLMVEFHPTALCSTGTSKVKTQA